MTVSKNLKIQCNNCYETQRWSISILRDRKLDSILENHGYTEKYHGFAKGKTHWCSDCNDREKKTFYVVSGSGEEYLGTIEAWGIVDARRVAWEQFNCENMPMREPEDAIQKLSENVPKEVLNGIEDLADGDTATLEDLREALDNE